MPVINFVAASTFYKNTCRRRERSSAFELWYHRVPNLSTCCNLLNYGTFEDNTTEACRRQIWFCSCFFHSFHPSCSVGVIVYFWRIIVGWIEPGTIGKLKNHLVDINRNWQIETANLLRIRNAPTEIVLDTSDSLRVGNSGGEDIVLERLQKLLPTTDKQDARQQPDSQPDEQKRV